MERRRSLGGFFKFFIEPTELNFDYGKQKTLTDEDWLLEVGTINGSYSTVTKKSTITNKNETYWMLEGRGSGQETVAFINFKTYKDNQVVQLVAFDECNSPNDFLAIGKLDSLERSPLQAKLNNSTEQTISFTVPTAGSHFIKVYYYQHNDADTVSYQVTTHTNHAGYIRFVSYYNQYEWGYDKPDVQQILVKSYTGWILVSKPSWINLDKTYDRSGKKYLNIECQGNPGEARTGSLILKEKKKDSQISITINQGANPHPNDIILTLDKSGFANVDELTSETGKSFDIKVKLIGETSYTISNVNSNKYSITKSSDGTVITVKNNSDYDIGNQNVSFKVVGNNGTSKDINIYEDNIECYCDCNEDLGCGCHVEQTYEKKKIDCSGCHNGYESCVSDDGTCNSHQAILCTCYGAVGCNGCKDSYTASECPCQNAVSCTGCKNSYSPDVCNSCYNSVGCNGCHGTYTASQCPCQGSVGCNNCHSNYSSGGCSSCYNSQGCSGCHSSKSCSCEGTVGCNGCHGSYADPYCPCQGSVSCSGCHDSNTATTCNDKNNRPWDNKFYIKLTISTSLWTSNTTHYALFKIVKNSVTHWIFVSQELPINSSRDVALPYNVLGGYIKQAKFYFDEHGTESYIVSDISKQVLQNYPVSISVVSSNRFGVFNRYTDTDIMANNGGNWCSGYEYTSCSCNGSKSCGCDSSYSAGGCSSCYNSQGCSGCHSSKSCSCEGTASCNGCHGSYADPYCPCQGSVGCNNCHSNYTASSCPCQGSVGCNGCQGSYTASQCPCQGSVGCSGCKSAYTPSSCPCQGSVGCNECHSGDERSSCECQGSKSCSGCYENYIASSCPCQGSVGCPGCHGSYTASSCPCQGSKSCTGCDSSYSAGGCSSCYNSQGCSGCHGSYTASSCPCQGSVGCNGCHGSYSGSSCPCQGSVSCSGCHEGNTYLPDITQSFTIQCPQIIDVPWYITGMVLRIGPFMINDEKTYNITKTTQDINVSLPGVCAGRALEEATIYNNSNATLFGNAVNFTKMTIKAGPGGMYGINTNDNNTIGNGSGILLNLRKSTKSSGSYNYSNEWCDGNGPTQCACQGSKSCTGCDSSYSAGGCSSCYNSQGCSGCNGNYTSSSCPCQGSVGCNGCHGSYSGSSCPCQGSVGCSNCHYNYTSASCPCQGSVGCSNCHSSYTSSSCPCQGAVGCTGCDTAYTEYTCVCNSKVFHPHCDCHEYCPCEGYVIPVVE